MKLSVNDLNVFVNTPKDIVKLCEDLSRLGLEVESCIPCIAPKNVVVGKVLEKAPIKTPKNSACVKWMWAKKCCKSCVGLKMSRQTNSCQSL